jgi:hypothetical protein
VESLAAGPDRAPVPANDAFFDGAVNRPLHGHYVNPTVQLALPIQHPIVRRTRRFTVLLAG